MISHPAHPKRGLLAALVSTVTSSLAWVYAANAVIVLGVCSTAFFERVLGVLLLIPIIWSFRQKLPTLTELRPHQRTILIVALGRDVISTLLCQAALLYTASNKVMFLTKIEPYLVLLFGIVLHRTRLTMLSGALLSLHLIGALLLSFGDTGRTLRLDQIGDFLLLAGVIVNSCCYERSSQMARQFGALRSSLISQAVALPFLAILAFSIGNNIFNLAPADFEIAVYNIFLTVILFSVIAITTWFYALRELPSWLVSALRSLGPVIAAPIAWIYYEQTLSQMQIIGAVFIIATSLALMLEKRPSISNHGASIATAINP
jgi:drug/metabolite transporter (DMT)-like permease